MKLSKKELKEIRAGASVTGTLINSLIRGVSIVIDAGRYLGSSIRRMYTKNYCSMK